MTTVMNLSPAKTALANYLILRNESIINEKNQVLLKHFTDLDYDISEIETTLEIKDGEKELQFYVIAKVGTLLKSTYLSDYIRQHAYYQPSNDARKKTNNLLQDCLNEIKAAAQLKLQNQQTKYAKDAQDKLDVKIKEEQALVPLKLWAESHGSELLKERIKGDFEWVEIANKEYFVSITPGDYQLLSHPDKSKQIRKPSLIEMQSLQHEKSIYPTASLMEYTYNDDDDDDDDDDKNTVYRLIEIRLDGLLHDKHYQHVVKFLTK